MTWKLVSDLPIFANVRANSSLSAAGGSKRVPHYLGINCRRANALFVANHVASIIQTGITGGECF